MNFLKIICQITFLVTITTSSASAKHVAMAHLNTNGAHEVTAWVVKITLERIGYNVNLKTGSEDSLFYKLAEGEIDLLIGAWLPNTHQDYWNEYKEKLVRIGLLYEEAAHQWAVPKYIPASTLSSVADLKKAEVLEKIEKNINVPNKDFLLQQASEKLFEEYKLADVNYQITTTKRKTWLEKINLWTEKKQWFVLPVWQPSYVNSSYKLRMLEGTEKSMGGLNMAYMVANKEAFSNLHKQTRKILERIELSAKQIRFIETTINSKKLSPREAAASWLAVHPYTVEYWLGVDSEEE